MEVVTEQENNDYPIGELEQICQTIENMDKYNQIEILKIIHSQNKKCINENKYGIHINMTELSNNILLEINNHIKYVDEQEIEIKNVEKTKDIYISNFFSNNNATF